jgi:hypothetical protein
MGAIFTLVDLECRPVWSLELPEDYYIPGDSEAIEELLQTMRKRGAILGADRPRQFDVFVAGTSQRATFGVQHAKGGKWRISEIGRATYSLKAIKTAPTVVPK